MKNQKHGKTNGHLALGPKREALTPDDGFRPGPNGPEYGRNLSRI